MAEFAFAICSPGLERAVKLDVARVRPGLRFSYSRPGLVTFKAPRPIAPEDACPTPFARVWGRSLGGARDVGAVLRLLAPYAVQRLHVFARDPETTLSLEPWRSGLAGHAPEGRASSGELVADVVVATGEPAWVGLHRVAAGGFAEPGGAVGAPIPVESPSRAFAKVEEAIAWSGLPVREGQVALELGSAPGGASLALAMRGVTVWGVDPAEMDPAVLGYRGPADARVHHLHAKVGAVRWEALPPRVDWLLSDMNLAPQVVVHELARLVPPIRAHLRGAIITLKLNDWSFVSELPGLARRIEGLGFGAVRMQHLPSHRREVCAVALRSR